MITTRESASFPQPPVWIDPNFLGAKELVGIDAGKICVVRHGIPGLIRYLQSLGPTANRNWDAYILDRPDAGGMYVFTFEQFWLGVAVLITGQGPSTREECREMLRNLLTHWSEVTEGLSQRQYSEEEIQCAFDIHEHARSEVTETASTATRPAVVVDKNRRIRGAVIPDIHLLNTLERDFRQTSSMPSGPVASGRVLPTASRPPLEEPAALIPVDEMERRDFDAAESPPVAGLKMGRAEFRRNMEVDYLKKDILDYKIAMSLADMKLEQARFVRTPHMKAPKQVTQGQRLSVLVFMDQEKPEEGEVSSGIDIIVPSEVQRLDFTVWLTGTEHFTIANPMKKLSVDRSKTRSDSAAFDVIVRDDFKDDVEGQLLAVFCYNNRACGNVSRTVKVLRENSASVTSVPAAERRNPVLRVDTEAQSSDLTLVITNPSGDERTFECQIATPLFANSNPERTTWLLPSKTKDLVDSYFRLFLKPPPSENDPTRLAYLRGAGKHLFKATPLRFQEIYWELIDAGQPLQTISIVTDEPYFPWELIIPYRKGEERKALGVEFAIGRTASRDYMTPPQVVGLKESWVFAPIYRGNNPPPLTNAQAEATFVTTQFRGDLVEPADFAGFENAMLRPRSLVHFVCHGNATTAGQSIYDYNNVELFSTAFNGGQHTPRAYEKAKPFVFLNACKVGQVDRSFNGLGGFAPTFLELGASCVIAPLWSVKDTVAHMIAREFYEETVKNPRLPFASILSAIRARAYEKGEDTYAAYCFYGDPLASRLPP